MFGSAILEIAIGLALIYLLLSIVVTGITETFSRIAALRSKNLYAGVKNLLDDLGGTGLAADFYNSSLLKSLTQPGERPALISLFRGDRERRPSYITNEIFRSSLMLLLREKSGESDIAKAIGKLRNDPKLLAESPNLKANLLNFFDEAEQDVQKFTKSVENWFDDGMVRVTGWYKRQAHTVSLAAALVVAVSLNASTLDIAEELWLNESQRTALADVAVKVVEDKKFADSEVEPGNKTAIENAKEALDIINSSQSLPLGWRNIDVRKWKASDWFSHLLGWIITAFALSLGAPFWFETLRKAANLRTAGANPVEQSGKPGS